MRGYRDNMIRSLPDVKDIINKKPKNVVSLTDDGDEAKESDSPNSQMHQAPPAPSQPAVVVPPVVVPPAPDNGVGAPPPTTPMNNGSGG